ncbi:MAG: 30S ribosomal protein S17 [Candidatus Colwellbacteria bacterium]|nr:30S ribosomal protein S17 [Candidatus Colwellbacteria bacterium]
MTNKEVKKRRLQGVVTSNKMDKTVVVSVTRLVKDPKYLKYRKRTRKFKAHDEENAYSRGDEVTIEETRPVSKDKRWRVVSLIQKTESKNE